MPKSLSAPLTFYPAYCFSLSSTHNTWARLTAVDVHALKERAGFEVSKRGVPKPTQQAVGLLPPAPLGQNLYFHLNHPIKWIRLVGVIVAVDIYPTRWIMSLDDSSGTTIEITCGRQKPVQATLPAKDAETAGFLHAPTEGHTATGLHIDLKGIDIGSVVKLKGGVGSFRGEKQVLLERMSVIRTTNEEAAAWAENAEFRRSVLDVPWVVSEKDEKRARRKAEGLDRERRAREERKRKRRIELNTTKKPKDRVSRQLTAEQGKQKIEEANRTAAEKKTQLQAHMKRAQERKAREQEFERLRAQEAKRRLDSDESLRLEKAQLEENQQAIAEVEKQRHEEDLRLAAEMEKKERAKSRRAEERKMREQEFERLQRRKEIEREERSATAT